MVNEQYVLDAYAWIEYFIGSDAGIKVRDILEREDSQVYTCAVTVAEIISKTARQGRSTEDAYDIIVNDSRVIDVNEQLSKETALLHARMRKTVKDFGLADAYVLATAKKINAKILTGDRHFKDVKEAILIN